MISRLVFLGSLNHIETGFRGLQNGFFGFSSGGYWEMGVPLVRKQAELVRECYFGAGENQ